MCILTHITPWETTQRGFFCWKTLTMCEGHYFSQYYPDLRTRYSEPVVRKFGQRLGRTTKTHQHKGSYLEYKLEECTLATPNTPGIMAWASLRAIMFRRSDYYSLCYVPPGTRYRRGTMEYSTLKNARTVPVILTKALVLLSKPRYAFPDIPNTDPHAALNVYRDLLTDRARWDNWHKTNKMPDFPINKHAVVYNDTQ